MTKRFRVWPLLVLTATVLAACGGGGSDGSKPVVVDQARPLVSYVTPANNEAAAPTNLTISVAFSKPMDSASLRAAIGLMHTQTDAQVPLSDLKYDPLNKIVTVTPLKPLDGNASYRATVSGAATDINGNAMGDDYTWTFSSSNVADMTRPTVDSVSPENGASNTPLQAAVALSFSEAMSVPSLGRAFRLEANGTAVTGRLEYIAQAAVFTPDSPLAPNTTYTATLGTAATDLADNALATAYRWKFTTGALADTTPPVVLSVTPVPQATNVAADSAITIQFNEPIFPAVFGTIDGFVTPVSINYDTNTMTVRPSTGLKAGNTYTSRVAVRDLAGNAMAEAYEWRFTIAP